MQEGGGADALVVRLAFELAGKATVIRLTVEALGTLAAAATFSGPSTAVRMMLLKSLEF
jgi:hypothetical protein